MQTQEAPVREAVLEQPDTKHRSWTPLLIVAAVVLGLIAVGLAIWALVASDDDASDPQLDAVTEMVDTMHEGLNNEDAELAASVFTEDGVWLWESEIPVTSGFEGALDAGLSNWERVSDVTELGENHYTFVQQWHSGNDVLQRNVVVVELEGDLLVQAEWVADFYTPTD